MIAVSLNARQISEGSRRRFSYPLDNCELCGIVYHDANASKKLDLRFAVSPRESIGASNNPKTRLGPPKYDAARFLVRELPIALAVTLQQP